MAKGVIYVENIRAGWSTATRGGCCVLDSAEDEEDIGPTGRKESAWSGGFLWRLRVKQGVSCALNRPVATSQSAGYSP